MRTYDRPLPLVGPRRLRRPAAVPAGARPHPVGAAGLVPASAASWRSRRRRCRSPRATRSICTPSRPSSTTPGGGRTPLYLHTSPEFTCKKLLAAGEPRVFSLRHVFRNRERGPLHHPEFTMLEWYRTNEPYEALMAGLRGDPGRGRQGRRRAAAAMEGPHRRSLCRAGAAQRRRRIRAVRRHRSAGDARRRRARPRQARRGGAGGRHPGRGRRHLVGHLQPRAGRAHRAAARASAAPTLLDRYPLPEAAWAQPADDPRLAQRFELYACGVELANGFAETHRRGRAAPALRGGDGGAAAPLWRAVSDRRRFPRGARAMPPASGIALGFDRLVMLATGAPRIEQVLWAPVAGDDR